jgi:hypothetical protein
MSTPGPGKPAAKCMERIFEKMSFIYGLVVLDTPVLVRSPKLSNIERSQYLDG